MSSAERTEIQTIACGSCEREWPVISEQAVVYDKVGVCYACFIQDVVVERDKRLEEVNYKIENCSSCTGIPGAREKCTTCFGRGWVESRGESLIKLIQ